MDYRVVFDITDAGYKSWTFPAHGLIFVTLGVALVALQKRLPGLSRGFSFFFLGFAVLWTGWAFAATYCEYSSLITAKKTGRVKVVEGTVTNFKPMPFTGHVDERFCVRDVCFEYSDYGITGGFNNTTSHGGPIKEGLPVRVTHVSNAIVKLEVAR